MPDVTSPFAFPYPEDTDLVRDGAAAIQSLAEAVNDAGVAGELGGLVAVKHAIFTGTQTNSTAAGANFNVTNLSITHEVADAANKLIISAFLGSAASQRELGNVGLAIFDGTSFIALGDSSGDRARVTAGGLISGTGAQFVMTMPSVTFVHTPGAGSKTYTVRAINMDGVTNILYINRSQRNTDTRQDPAAVSALVIQEVRV